MKLCPRSALRAGRLESLPADSGVKVQLWNAGFARVCQHSHQHLFLCLALRPRRFLPAWSPLRCCLIDPGVAP